ncbi:ABC transporter ATP-binding protein [Rhodoferax sp.]|uniref:ABC transporter ATP-binding protein n=1 Tax=Rhodoferax sp. TaxID=50421 RepID=UPI00283CC9F5|nr:ABC transporter ATP-binding protein [Rhodoferax sp.]MDR3371542.1 ABC transporter ATP-binding protein [Rhodoferax sp.]
MARIKLQNVQKHYGRGGTAFHALRGISLEMCSGEFVALLGPSGSGKTTLLRAVAGLETIDAGSIHIGDDLVAAPGRHVLPERRNVGVVFQSHALWPHMTVFDNVLFPLRESGLTESQARPRVMEALAQVELHTLAQRTPGELSGGQKQRVALARAMVARPRVVLFDEPLASLDVELRRDMMRHIDQMRSPDCSMMYVTHNQEEALALADRVVVVHEGRIEQIDTPTRLCREPQTDMVARFVGSGNLLNARRLSATQSGVARVAIGEYDFQARDMASADASVQVRLCLAPTAFVLVQPSMPGLSVHVEHVFFQGNSFAVDAVLQGELAVPLSLVLPFEAQPRRGELLRLQVRDAWVMPEVTPISQPAA